MKRKKAKEEKQKEQRMEEEENWSKALSGELSGPRRAALGAVQGVAQTQQLIDVIDDKDEYLYTAMYKGEDQLIKSVRIVLGYYARCYILLSIVIM